MVEAQAPSFLERVPEARFFCDGFGAGVYHPVPDGYVFCPERHETPVLIVEPDFSIVFGDRHDFLCRRNIVVGCDLTGNLFNGKIVLELS